jgi:hypothetical protein
MRWKFFTKTVNSKKRSRPFDISQVPTSRTIYLTEEDLGEHEVALDERYWALLPNHGADLTARFESILREKPWAFAPLPI